MREEEATRQRRRTTVVVAGSVAAVLALGGGVTAVVLTADRSATNSAPAAAGDGAGAGAGTFVNVQTFTEEANHVTGTVNYPQTPPAGGNHSAVWLNCGIYPTPVPDENAVHDLEHGAVWITYTPTLPAADVATLTALVRSRNTGDPDPHVLLSPYPGLPAPVVVSAWATQLRLTGANDPQLPLFVTKYLRGAQAPEATESCSGGIGTPSP